ncbi:MAG: helix-turn-helix transcriptional regulator [Pseudomonadota bacterium]|jgi:DNA-binding NarL/FixJ family response regulator|uniref:helix-turn-helix domain-containing protein n=1 Tax=Alteromonas sp. 009811495 TaxID=3002962 RepID=UPI00237E7465|nr:helix-turn-helix transcriptional regulator [Alteromonas sp. 009811495]WDT85681.1 helix-turn-helix transcriptional regulator [Alteromonas sp. 009811495]
MRTHEIREKSVLMTAEERRHVTATGITSSELVMPIDCLSKRELQVAHKIMEGHSNKAIALELFISERTVKFHCANIYKKLNITSRTALIAGCFRTLYQEAVSS